MKHAVTLFLPLLFTCILLCAAQAEDVSPYASVPYPKGVEAEEFDISLDGFLMYQHGSKRQVYQNGRWQDAQGAEPLRRLPVEGEFREFSILQDGKVIFTDTLMQTIYPVSAELAYGTRMNAVYAIDLKSGRYQSLCYVDGWDGFDAADRILVSGDVAYVIQSQISFIQAIDLSMIRAMGLQSLRIAVASPFDIGNVVLESATQLYHQNHPGAVIDLVRLTEDQLRLDLMSARDSYDMVICQTALWNDLADSGLFEPFDDHERLTQGLEALLDMRSLCGVNGRMYAMPLWDNIATLCVNADLMGVLKDVTWPEATWTWDDFLALAQACCRDLTGNGKPDLFIAYQRSFESFYSEEGYQHYALPVRQTAALYQAGLLQDVQCEEVLHMLSIWKICYKSGYLYLADGYAMEPHMASVIFSWPMPASWAEMTDENLRFCWPNLNDLLGGTPTDAVLMSINAYSPNMEQAIEFMTDYMATGADEHGFTKEPRHERENLIPYVDNLAEPSPFYESHYRAMIQQALRAPWIGSLYNEMDRQLNRYLQDDISAEECARLWQEKLRMTRME